MEHMIDLVSRLLKRRMFRDNPNMAVKVTEELCKGWKSHNTVIIEPDLEGKLKLINSNSEEWREPWKLNGNYIGYVGEYSHRVRKYLTASRNSIRAVKY